MLLADFAIEKKGQKGNWQGGNYPSESYRKDTKSKDASINLYDPAGYGTGSYGYYPKYQRKTHTNYKMGGDGQMVYGTDGYGSHNNIGLRGYLTQSLNNDVMIHGDYAGRNLPDEAVDAYAGNKTRRRGDAYNQTQKWLRGKASKVRQYSAMYQKKMQQHT